MMKMNNPSLNIISCILLLLLLIFPGANAKWDMLLPNIGISAMHMQLLHTDHVIIFDRTDFGRSNISLPKGKCRVDPRDTALNHDCTAHSVQYDVASNSIRPLMVLTDVWCSSGAVMLDGTLAQAGGFNDGDHAVRLYRPCTDNSCDWEEMKTALTQRRWYATSHILGDGRQIIVGGRRQFNYEFYPSKYGSYNMPFLVQTNDPGIENNLYPFVFLNEDGNLFIFANNRAILFNYLNDTVVRSYPTMPGGHPRNYPSTGSAVLLPLRSNIGGEVMVCGGAPKGAFVRANKGEFGRALDTCGRIRINDLNPKWVMETMPSGRVMGDMILLPNGNVLIINGAGSGTAGWELGRTPILAPVIYNPNNRIGSRFESLEPSRKPRMYHSTAILVRDGRILVGGSNPHIYYNFTGVLFPTDLSLQSFSPPYLDPKLAYLRPQIVLPVSQSKIGYGQKFGLRVKISIGQRLDTSSIMVTMIAPSFTTHSFAMSQRLIVLDPESVVPIATSTYQIRITATNSPNIAPPGYYLLFVVHKDIPSHGIWIQIH